MAGKHLYVVFGNPASPDRDAEFNQWYDGTHIPDILALPGIASAQRFRVSPLDGGTSAKFTYMTVYEVEGDPNEILAKIGAGTASGAVRMEGAPLDMAGMSMAFWTPITEKVESE
jgi:hypothetical protein